MRIRASFALGIAALAALLGGGAAAQDPEGLPVASEQAIFDEIMKPYIEEAPKWVEKGNTREFVYQNGPVWIRLGVSEETGRVTSLNSNSPPITNTELRRMAELLPELEVLKLGHWGNQRYKDRFSQEDFSGAGLDAFSDSNLREFAAMGTMFNNDGAAAAARIKGLRSFKDHHSRTDYQTSLSLMAQNPTVEEIVVSSAFSDKFTDSHLPLFTKVPNLKHIRIEQSFVTWEGGLHHLAPMQDQLESITFWNSFVFPEDLEKLRAALPDTTIEFTPELSDPRHQIRSSNGVPRLEKWVDPETLTRIRETLDSTKPDA